MAHNRSVLKERRITPGTLTGFAVAECRGWRLGLVGGGGSAGSVLRSQGTLGPVGLSRFRATGIRMSTFLCSLRTGPAAARGALWNPLRCQKHIPLYGLGLGSWLRSCLHEGSWGSATWTRNSDPHPDNGPWTTTGPRITCNLER